MKSHQRLPVFAESEFPEKSLLTGKKYSRYLERFRSANNIITLPTGRLLAGWSYVRRDKTIYADGVPDKIVKSSSGTYRDLRSQNWLEWDEFSKQPHGCDLRCDMCAVDQSSHVTLRVVPERPNVPTSGYFVRCIKIILLKSRTVYSRDAMSLACRAQVSTPVTMKTCFFIIIGNY